jgi:hypothetical protein
MNPQLHNILLKLEESDLPESDYFKWTEEQKLELTEDILKVFSSIIEMNNPDTEHLLFCLILSVERAEDFENYEEADILNRVYRALLVKMGLEHIY